MHARRDYLRNQGQRVVAKHEVCHCPAEHGEHQDGSHLLQQRQLSYIMHQEAAQKTHAHDNWEQLTPVMAIEMCERHKASHLPDTPLGDCSSLSST